MSNGYSDDSSKDTITPYQSFTILFSTVGILGISVSSLGLKPIRRFIAGMVGPDGIWLLLITGFIAWGIHYLFFRLCQFYPRRTIAQFTADLVGNKHPAWGKVLSVIVILPLLSLWLLLIAFMARIFGETSVVINYPNTPIQVIIGSLLLVCMLAANSKPGIIARLNELVFPINIVMFVISAIAIGRVIDFKHVTNLLPLFQVDWLTGLKAILFFGVSFIGMEVVFFYAGYYQKPEKSFIPHSIALWFSTLYFIIMYLVTIAVFGVAELKNMAWPLAEVVKVLEFPLGIVERWETALIAVWTAMAFTSISNLFTAVVGTINNLLEIPDKKSKTITWMLGVGLYFLANAPKTFQQLLFLYQYWIEIIFGIVLGILLILFPIAWIRNRKGGDSRVTPSS